MAFAIFMGFIVSAFMTIFGNKIAQKIMPTFEK
jgi:hypothetical protein